MDQPGQVAIPARGQLNRKNGFFPVPVRAWEFGLAGQVRPSRPASACSLSTLSLNLVYYVIVQCSVVQYSAVQCSTFR